ncbi:MAG: helix-turn-helix domain-containing protein [Euryarchaeota archaeon]|nr:helix-turn-helix domain-containing protein [Euryarchaeota archaeon]
MAGELISARFRMPIPDGVWTKEVSMSFPEARFRLLAGVPTDEGAMCLGEVIGDKAAAAGEAIRDHSEIVDYDELYTDAQRTIAQYKGTKRPFFDLFGSTSLPPEFPTVARNGTVEFDVTVTREQFEQLGAVLEDRGVTYELVSVVRDRESESVLTERQRECLSVALGAGYFQVPRECTLADVAERLGVDKSTASKTIRRGAARVLEWFLVGQRSHTDPQMP